MTEKRRYREREGVVAVNVGNTNIGIAVYGRDRMMAAIAFPVSNFYEQAVFETRIGNLIGDRAPEGIILCSVNPPLTAGVVGQLEAICGLKAQVLHYRTRTGMPIAYRTPAKLGMDRVAGAVAAVERFGAPVITVDAGTAITINAVNDKGSFLGGAIMPGFSLQAGVLAEKTARLPLVTEFRPCSVIGADTQDCIQSGILNGISGAVMNIIKLTREKLNHDAPVAITGGAGTLLCLAVSDAVFCPHLVLDGLKVIWDRNRMPSRRKRGA